MADSTPARAKAMPVARKAPESPAPENTLAPLRVTYYRRMKRQRVYTVTVAWDRRRSGSPAPEGAQVSVRLLMAGAQVLPAERTLNPAKADDRATFYVTPLAKGWLRAETLQVLVGGRKVEEIRLPAKVVSQRPTWILLALTFLIPWLVLTYLKYSPLQESLLSPGMTLQRRILDNVPEFPDIVEERAPEVAGWIETVPRHLGDFYEVAYQYARDKPVAFYAAAALLLLTLLSWLRNRDRRKRIRTRPLPVQRPVVLEDKEPATRKGEALAG